MKKFLFLISMGILFAALVTPAYTSDHKDKQSYNGHLGDIDADDDDQLNWKEFKQYFPHAEKDVFKKIDANNDGLIDHDEWHEFKAAHGYKHKD